MPRMTPHTFTDDLIERYLSSDPKLRDAYQHDPTMHHQVDWARGLLSVVELAMRSEGVPADTGERVLAEAVRAGFAGWGREELRRERALLLATFDPSEFGSLPNPVFTEPGREAVERPRATQSSEGEDTPPCPA